jgi:hypothetical protein
LMYVVGCLMYVARCSPSIHPFIHASINPFSHQSLYHIGLQRYPFWQGKSLFARLAHTEATIFVKHLDEWVTDQCLTRKPFSLSMACVLYILLFRASLLFIAEPTYIA